MYVLVIALTFSYVTCVNTDKQKKNGSLNTFFVKFPAKLQVNLSATPATEKIPEKRREKRCDFKIDEYDLFKFSQVAHYKLTNIIQVRLYVVDKSKTNEIFPQWDFVFADRIGRDIEFVHRNHYDSRVLTVGKQVVDLVIYENPHGCFEREKRGDFVAGKLLSFLKSSLNTGHEMCYYEKGRRRKQRCCQIFGESQRNHMCYEFSPSDFVTKMEYFQYIFIVTAFPISLFIFYVYILLLYQTDRKEIYCKLQDSPLSATRVVLMVFWHGSGMVKSFFRRLLFICLISYVPLSCFKVNEIKDISFVYLSLLFYIFSDMFSSKTISLGKKFIERFLDIFAEEVYFDVKDLNFSGLKGALNLISLPVNFERWKTALQKVKTRCKYLPEVLSLLVCFSHVIFGTIALFFLIFVIVLNEIISGFVNISEIYRLEKMVSFISFCIAIQRFILLFELFLFVCATWLYLLVCSMYLIFGIVANAAYFTPYIIFISVFVFYIWKFWQSVEDRYFSLKLLIHEECRDIESKQPSDASPPVEDEVIEGQASVLVYQELYDFVRKEILPYQFGLFWFFVKCLCLTVFAYLVLTWIKFLEASDATTTVHVFTTLGVSCFPYVLKIIVGKIRKEEKIAWKESKRNSVKNLIRKFSKNQTNTEKALYPFIMYAHKQCYRNTGTNPDRIHDSEAESMERAEAGSPVKD